MRRNLDAVDKRILNELQAHGRMSIVDLAERVHLTKTPCSERVKRLEREGVITGYSATIDPVEVDMGHVMIVHVNLSKTSDSSLEDFNRAVRRIPQVQSCLMIAGPFDYMLKVRTRDITEFRELLGERISQLPSVMQTHSFAVMELVKETGMIELRS
ncbi:AsnC family transcriptional regulator [Hoeflea halophila]|uniref:AsnC family transcriptional regulator n=1 Tax=Hoeflea halophila TaxID=714899 RepID=A0A286I7I4_9HYPH|nr:Lrp/AsnC ligand binding domain-containing protein [Hoeflea halophila]SOE16022.1 AsnC family transcriptional regulator [Hoeflea halophila]